MLHWSTGLEKFEQVSGTFGEPGATAHMHIREKGKVHILKDKLISMDPEKIIRSEVSGTGIFAIVETTFESISGACRISLHWSGKGTSPISRLMLPLVRKKIINLARRELNTFKNLVEQYGPVFPPLNLS